jgi:hypothetical protein
MGSNWLYMVRMDVAHDRQTLFNELYNGEHIPALLAVPGVRRASRYRNPSPTDPRYVALYEVDGPEVIESAAWKAASDSGRWPSEVRPFTMNRHLVLYERLGPATGLTYSTPYIFLVMMDVEPHREALFNELYDNEHVPVMLGLSGCVNAVRYRTQAPGEPRYLAAYEVARADLPNSSLWHDTSDIGRWKPEVRPYTYNKRFILCERIWPR